MSPRPNISNTKAIFLLVGAVFVLSIMDACVKAISGQVGTVPALWARYGGQMLVVLLLVMPRLSQVVRTQYLGLQLTRSVLLLAATALFFQGLSRIGLAQATAVLIINPVFITLGAGLFLGERVGLRRWSAVLVAFVGALIVIQPGAQTFQPAALFPLAGAVCFAGYALATRAVGRDEDPWTSLFYTALVGCAVTSIFAPSAWVPLTPQTAGLMLGIAVTGTVGQLLMITAFSHAPASVLAPFGYGGVVFAIGIGYWAFAEIPAMSTLLGAVVIIAAGIYVWTRERYLAANRSTQP